GGRGGGFQDGEGGVVGAEVMAEAGFFRSVGHREHLGSGEGRLAGRAGEGGRASFIVQAIGTRGKARPPLVDAADISQESSARIRPLCLSGTRTSWQCPA